MLASDFIDWAKFLDWRKFINESVDIRANGVGFVLCDCAYWHGLIRFGGFEDGRNGRPINAGLLRASYCFERQQDMEIQ